MSTELELHFPHYAAGRKSLSLIKRFTAARLNHALNPGEESEMIYNALCREMAQTNRPMKFSPPGQGVNPTGNNALTAHLAEFHELCAMIEKNYNTQAKTLPLYEFLMRLESLKKEVSRNTPSPENMPPVK